MTIEAFTCGLRTKVVPSDLPTMDPEKRTLADVLNIPCAQCGMDARLIGIEEAPNGGFHIMTFECPQGHVTTTTFPN
jgi:hypothetical protein